ncbi:MAG: type II toxin-antitoxin system RelE/ParE family toxin [Xanthomonadales bacterium PRO7]|jgi:phage-related protein|nr:type II toxin-antitoxin system RelE/ParE family toxin [Xanthomonadales bacterium PRO7]HMM57528.1 type II toxin-antitoxin system RelE/ParE family toxin [Rudaea sp.]
MKAAIWLGNSKTDWNAFPESAQDEAGYQLDKVQRGEEPSDWKPMPSIGSGVCELRVHDEAGAFRAIYLATRPEGVYVLHAFQKKTRATSLHDIRKAQERFKLIPR